MKKNVILAAASAAAVVGLMSACGTNTHTAQPISPDKDCTELAKPNDPNNLIGNEWPWPACDALSDVTPGVDQARAEAIVFDARQHVEAAKRSISLLATDGNKVADSEARDGYRAKIEDIRGRLADDLMRSHAALEGHAPEGFSLAYSTRPNPLSCSDAMDFQACIESSKHSASPGVTGGGR